VNSGELSINAYAPVIRQSADSYAERLQTENEVYAITSDIGFDTASFVLRGPVEYLVDWFQNGLVRDVVWKAPDASTCWEGYVSRLVFNAGANARTKTVEGMANRILFVYTPVDTAQNPPTAGAQTTITKNDTSSQAKYGIKQAIVSGNECPAATADDMALAELTRLKEILTDETISVYSGREPYLTVEMRGYAHMCNWWVYEQTTSSGTADADTMVAAILAADPNSVISTSTANINANATAIDQYHDERSTGWKLIQDITSRGLETGGVGYFWTCGVYEGRRVTFKAAEWIDDDDVPLSTNKYLALHRQMFDPGDSILDDAGREVMPWEVRPDRLVYTAGLPGRPLYVTQVKYKPPTGLTLSGTDGGLRPMKNMITGSCK
jgi:hypothetical protein